MEASLGTAGACRRRVRDIASLASRSLAVGWLSGGVDGAARWQSATEHSDGGGGLGGVGVGKAHRRLVNRDDILAKGMVSTRGGRPAVR